jgi:hypothetical protein
VIGEWFQEGDSFMILGKELAPARYSSDGTGIRPVSLRSSGYLAIRKNGEVGGALSSTTYFMQCGLDQGKRGCICMAQITSKSLMVKIL